MRLFFQNHWQLLVLTALVFALWNFPVIYPLKMLVVFLHELSHAIAAWLTGGSVSELSLSVREGGAAVTIGGSLFVIASAGYLGSLILGAGLFLVSIRTHWDRFAVGALGAIMISLTIIYMREMFAVAFCLLTGTVLLGIAKYLPRLVNDLLLRVIGLTSLLYVPYDIFSDTLKRSGQVSDARIIATTVGGPTVFWGALWLLASLVVVFYVVKLSLARPSNVPLSFKD